MNSKIIMLVPDVNVEYLFRWAKVTNTIDERGVLLCSKRREAYEWPNSRQS
jgi:hypothetical protein